MRENAHQRAQGDIVKLLVLFGQQSKMEIYSAYNDKRVENIYICLVFLLYKHLKPLISCQNCCLLIFC